MTPGRTFVGTISVSGSSKRNGAIMWRFTTPRQRRSLYVLAMLTSLVFATSASASPELPVRVTYTFCMPRSARELHRLIYRTRM
jgi:hypothetical protein